MDEITLLLRAVIVSGIIRQVVVYASCGDALSVIHTASIVAVDIISRLGPY